MKFVVLDAQGYYTINEFQVKELAIYDGQEISTWLFKPKILHRDLTPDQKKTVNYVFHNLHGIPYNAGYVDYKDLNRLLRDCFKDVHTVYVKGHVKKDFLLNAYSEMKVDPPPPTIINLEFSVNGGVPKLDSGFTHCKHHRIKVCSCSVKNVYVLYNYIVNLLPK